MKKLYLFLSILVCSFAVHADEGMWILKELNQESAARMQDMGFTFPLDSIYSEENPSLKDAVVIFGRGCTGVAVSQQGLIFTNHHCGYGSIQQHSSVKHDYLKDGFVSQSMEEELYTPGLKVSFLRKTEDVTDRIIGGLTPAHSEKERKAIIDSLSTEILNDYKELITDSAQLPKGVLKAYKEKDFVTAKIIPYYEGNKYYLVVYDVFEDVRMVLAPPSSLGRFGGDTDNWMWPRHTADFSVFRVYANENNEPTKYSKENKPYQPKYTVPVSLKGYDEGSYAMTIGYPGTTDRYLSSWGLKQTIESENKPRIEVRTTKQAIWGAAMNADDETRIKYAAKWQSSSNTWKNSIGMNAAVKRLDVIKGKEQLENEFREWLANNPSKNEKYGETLMTLDSAYSYSSELMKTGMYFTEVFNKGIELTYFPNVVLHATGKSAKDKEKFFEDKLVDSYKNYSPNLDKQLMPVLLKLYADRVPKEFLPSFYKTIDKKFKNDYVKYSEWVFKKTKFTNYESAMKVAKKNSKKEIMNDPATQILLGINGIRKMLMDTIAPSYDRMAKGSRLFMAGLQEMNPTKVYSPNANSTQRLSYGSIAGYKPKDAALYNYYSTTDGVLEKENPEQPEFEVQDYVISNLKSKNWGQYADKDQTMHVNFVSNNDITGGNSGSPVFNGQAELIGLAFDGNWEALSGDLVFEPNLQRTISVDIRYVLYIMDKVMNCSRIVNELELKK